MFTVSAPAALPNNSEPRALYGRDFPEVLPDLCPYDAAKITTNERRKCRRSCMHGAIDRKSVMKLWAGAPQNLTTRKPNYHHSIVYFASLGLTQFRLLFVGRLGRS